MFSILKKSRKLQLPIDMFDTLMLPILLYGSEITGFENHNMHERLCLQFYKIILNVNFVWELGRHPVSIDIKTRMIGFWQRLVNGKPDKISSKLYSILLAMHNRDLFQSNWLMLIKDILKYSGLVHNWLNQAHVPVNIS